MPERFDKLRMVIPIARIEGVLYNVEAYEGLHLPAGSNLAVLLGSYLSTLTDRVMTRNDNTPFDTIDVTLELSVSGTATTLENSTARSTLRTDQQIHRRASSGR
jgi:hypothetical protein